MARTLTDNTLVTKLEALTVEVVTESGTSHTFALSDANKILKTTNGGAVSIEFPNNTTIAYPVGTVIMFEHWGAGVLTFSAAAGVTVNAEAYTIERPYRSAFARKDATNTWILEGNLGVGPVTSGTWTPTLTNTTNISASTAYEFKYSRVVETEDIYTFSGEVDIDPTTTLTLTVLTLTLPVSTSVVNTYDVSGTASDDLGTSCRVAGTAASGTFQIRCTPVDVTNRRFSVIGQFKYIAP